VRRILEPFQQTRVDEHIQRSTHLVEVVAYIGGEPFAGQERTGMSMKEEEEIEVTRMPQGANAADEVFKTSTVHGAPVCRRPQSNGIIPAEAMRITLRPTDGMTPIPA
jgi:hypothetical protein